MALLLARSKSITAHDGGGTERVSVARGGCCRSDSAGGWRRMPRLTRASTHSAGVGAGSALRGGHFAVGRMASTLGKVMVGRITG